MKIMETKVILAIKKSAWAFLKRKERQPPKKPPSKRIAITLGREKLIMNDSRRGNVCSVFFKNCALTPTNMSITQNRHMFATVVITIW